MAEIESTPGSLAEALDALEDDHDYLLEGDVITQDVVDTWIEYKRENEGRCSQPAAASTRIPSLL